MFHNPESGFCVLRVKVRGQRDLVTVVGHAALIAPGEFVQASGMWVNDRTHGLQFRAAFLKPAPPTTLEGIERYLGSGMIGHRPGLRQKAGAGVRRGRVRRHRADEPERLREVPASGPSGRARSPPAGPSRRWSARSCCSCTATGSAPSRAVRIFKTYGADAVQLISREPVPPRPRHPGHRLQERRPDRAAARHREDGDDPGARRDQLRPGRGAWTRAIAACRPTSCVDAGRDAARDRRRRSIESALGLELEAGAVVADTVAGRPLRVPGRALPRRARHRRAASRRSPPAAPPWAAIDADKAIPWVEQQNRARPGRQPAGGGARWRSRSKVLVITGGPGVGKTTLVNAILTILRARTPGIALAAPTGRAAKRLRRQHRARGQDHPPAARGRPGATAASSATRSTRSTATCWSSTRSRWSTCR